MKLYVISVAASLVAAVLLNFILSATDAMARPLRLGAMVLVVVLGTATAWFLSKEKQTDDTAKIRVASSIDSSDDLEVENVDIDTLGAGGATVAEDIKSGGMTSVRNIRIRQGEAPK